MRVSTHSWSTSIAAPCARRSRARRTCLMLQGPLHLSGPPSSSAMSVTRKGVSRSIGSPRPSQALALPPPRLRWHPSTPMSGRAAARRRPSQDASLVSTSTIPRDAGCVHASSGGRVSPPGPRSFRSSRSLSLPRPWRSLSRLQRPLSPRPCLLPEPAWRTRASSTERARWCVTGSRRASS